MENNKTLKDEIVDAIKVELDGRFDAIDQRFDVVDKRFDSLKVEMDEGFRQQGVILEAMQGDINTLVDGQEILHDRIDRVQGTVLRIEAKVEEIDARLTAVEVV